MHFELGEPWLSIFSLREMANSMVGVGINDESTHRGDREEGQHVTTGQRGGKGFFRVGAIRISEVVWRCRGTKGLFTSRKGPLMSSRILFVAESLIAAFPFESGFVFAHGYCFGENRLEINGIS